MDDRFLKDQRREPDPAFAGRLRAQLRQIEDDAPPARSPRPLLVLGAAAALVAIGAVALFPGVRTQAQALLDLFRVREFAVVKVDAGRMQQLRDRKFDAASLLVGGSLHTEGETPPRPYSSAGAAAAAAGFTPALPAILPRGLAADTVWVHGEVHASGTVDSKSLRATMYAFDVRDLEVPSGVDGRAVAIHVPPMIAQSYRNGGGRVMLLQGASPEVTLPPGVDLSRLGEIGLRIAGVEPAEAHRLAEVIDWRTTLVVPVVASASTFQQVTVHGDRGLYVETAEGPEASGRHAGGGAAVLWTHDGRVFALTGRLGRVAMLQMAESVR